MSFSTKSWATAEELVILQTRSRFSGLCRSLPHSCTRACAPVGQPSPWEALHSRSPRRISVAGLGREQWGIPGLHLLLGLTGPPLPLCDLQTPQSPEPAGSSLAFSGTSTFHAAHRCHLPHAVGAEFVPRYTSKVWAAPQPQSTLALHHGKKQTNLCTDLGTGEHVHTGTHTQRGKELTGSCTQLHTQGISAERDTQCLIAGRSTKAGTLQPGAWSLTGKQNSTCMHRSPSSMLIDKGRCPGTLILGCAYQKHPGSKKV